MEDYSYSKTTYAVVDTKWWQVDLGQEHTIEALVIVPGPTGLSKDSTYIDLLSDTQEVTRTIVLAESIADCKNAIFSYGGEVARYIKIRSDKYRVSIQLREVEVYGNLVPTVCDDVVCC